MLSSVFGAVTFIKLLNGFLAGAALFRTGCFVELLLTELVVTLSVRTRRPFYQSRTGVALVSLTAAVVVLAAAIRYLRLAGLLGFVPMPSALLAAMLGITILYVAAAELLKRTFYRRRD